MLFIPKIDFIEKRCLNTNVARMVIQRVPSIANQHNLHENIIPGELENEFALAFDIAHDPNSLGHFSNDTPITNIIKRYKCQVELWKNILNLRQGRYYSSSYQIDDGISGLMQSLSNYDQGYFDTTDNLSTRDEGVLLKKLLSVFSIRPTFTQISSYVQRIAMGVANVNALSQTTFINLPVINIRLPSGGTNIGPIVRLSDAFDQTDFFIENKALVPKKRSVMYSKEMIFFYADRKHQVVNFAALTLNRNIALPQTFIGASQLNPTALDFNPIERIGRVDFEIKGILVLDTPPNLQIVTGCSAIIVKANENNGQSDYIKYCPSQAAIKEQVMGNAFESNKPFTLIPENSVGNNDGFFESA